ncbi:hypothetical protein IE077_002753 [Cardiosporidium cionae]|uniref:Uncharacterized protein n=1 Tax=Cardiosporidium cionae TaxID=476202 RepID=A0ABQ7JA90_9APIC|nr:hypothetical protein IE077_002753 [Cardiosporidium cionae]|eukprot:KAF8820844.1 hypothetical protein IE077_002753 [Cardiosporidium cionae]
MGISNGKQQFHSTASVLVAITCFMFSYSGTYLGNAQLVTEIYTTCTAAEGEQARCGANANCFIISGVPTCHCVVDTLSGLSTAGNPYKACTWDISGTWQLFSYIDKSTGFSREILNPTTNEPFVIRMDRTDALLKTKYMLGAIFIITALTSFSLGFCGRAFLDANDNTSIIFEQSEGFLDQNGRSILLRSPLLDTTLVKLHNKYTDRYDLKGKWQKSDGSDVDIKEMKKPEKWPNRRKTTLTKKGRSYWYNDISFGAPLLRLSMGIFLDTTLEPEKAAFNSDARFVQVGWYGALRYGSNRINIYSPADGKQIFTFLRIDTFPPLPAIGPSALRPATTQLIQPANNTGNATVAALLGDLGLRNVTAGLAPSTLTSGIFGTPLGGGGSGTSSIAAAGNILAGLTGIGGGAASSGTFSSAISPLASQFSNIFALSVPSESSISNQPNDRNLTQINTSIVTNN